MYLHRTEASKRLAAGKAVFASYYDVNERKQIRVEVKDIIDRGYGNYAIVSESHGVSLAMPWDRIQFSTKYFSY